MFTEYKLTAHVYIHTKRVSECVCVCERERERYSQRERVIGRDSTLITERERERDWTLMSDVFMCIYILVIVEGREGETEIERGVNIQIQREYTNKERHIEKARNTHTRARHKEKVRNMHTNTRARTHTHTHTH